MKKAAVIGDPVNHSLSPIIFSYLGKLFKTELEYSAKQVSASDLHSFIRHAQEEFIGLNVTIPHKESVLREADSLSLEARAVGAANVIHFVNGECQAHNTDVFGVIRALEENEVNLEGSRIVLMGAGGAARAMAFVAGFQKAAQVIIINKTLSRAQSLVSDFSLMYPNTQYQAFRNEVDLISFFSDSRNAGVLLVVNATPLGMDGFGFADSSFEKIFSLLTPAKNLFAFEMIYRPAMTPFLLQAKKKEMKSIGGLDMLVYQALATWEIWFGKFSNLREVKMGLSQHLGRFHLSETHKELLFLTGFMGVGKSTVGSFLAQKMGWVFVDLDREIEKLKGKSVSEIFQTEGEKVFRDVEAKVIGDVCQLKKAVIALGGGALTQLENLMAVKKAGYLVYLSASIEELSQRLTSATENIERPLLKSGSSLHDTISSLLQNRQAAYKQCDFEINTDKLDPTAVVEKIKKVLP